MANPQVKATRGHGLLEPLLAHLRAQRANKLIPDHLRTGRILDIGCGSYPYFLSHTYFAEKFAVDQLEKPSTVSNINWHSLDLNSEPALPFEDEYFDLVTMLAVVEHLAPNSLVMLFQDVHRVLRPGGRLIITTPAAWSDGLLHRMARLGLVSEDEINEHVYVYTLPLLGWYFGRAGFEMTKVKFGYFEFNLNLWATADR
ncbi:MAG TPA: class I SAM-dependent methyltransferase [Anaerolineales bacterium]|nr:class I SAM-dependent methyltransferase [Anaerolineales bacterium]